MQTATVDVRSSALRTLVNRYYASDIVAMMSTSFGDDDFVNIDNLLELQKEEKYSISVREMRNEE